MGTSIESVARQVAHGISVAQALVAADGGPRMFLRSLGWDLPPEVDDIGLAALDLSALLDKLVALEEDLSADLGGPVVDQKWTALFLALQDGLARVRALAAGGLTAPADYIAKTRIDTELLPRLVSMTLCAQLANASPFAFAVAQLCGVVTVERYPDDPSVFQVAHTRATIHWDALGRMFTDPRAQLASHYGWGTAGFDGHLLVANLGALVELVGMPSRVRALPRRVEELLTGAPAPDADTHPATQLVASFLRGHGDVGFDVGVSLYPLRPTTPGGADGGIGISPFAHGTAELAFPLTEQLSVELDATLALDSGIAMQLRPGRPVKLQSGLLGPGGLQSHASGRAVMLLTYRADPEADTKLRLASLPGDGVLEADEFAFGAGVELADGAVGPTVTGRLRGGHLLLPMGDADPFVGALAPRSGIEARFDLGLRWSAAEGFTFEGGAGAGIDLPLHLSLAGFTVEQLHVGLGASEHDLQLELSVTGNAQLGPLSVSIERVGARLGAAFHDGNLGPIDASLGFKSPEGAGLVLDARVVKGGGFIARDPARARYSGAFQLQVLERFQVQALGVVDTQLPGGGWSLAVLMSARFPGVPIGFGFVLDGLGGLVAVNRRADTDALRTLMRAGRFEALLFPTNLIADAPRILAGLDSAFPSVPGRYVLGPTARIGWGAPRVFSAEIGLFLEVPAPVRTVLLAAARLGLPSLDQALVDIRIDAMGVLDLERRTLALDASLHDSTLVGCKLTGDFAFRLGWGDQPEFLLAMGGFHPHFTPPPGFPQLGRLALTAGDNPQLRLQAYLALTSNTVQIGAHCDLTASGAGAEIKANLGFDALFELSPFHFEVEIKAGASVSWEGVHLLGLDLDFLLSGPQPWHAKGEATFGILWWDVTVGFDHTWGDTRALPGPSSADTLAALLKALHDSFVAEGAWTSELPDNEPAWVVFDTGGAALHPFAALVVRERALPLDYDITQFGNAPLGGRRRIAIAGVAVGGAAVPPHAVTPVSDSFAPGQFTRLTNDQRLAAPSFERFHSGVRIGAGEVAVGAVARSSMDVETIEIDPLAPPARPPRPVVLPARVATTAGMVRPSRPPPTPPRRGPRFDDLSYVIASTDDLSITATGAWLASGARTFAALREALARHIEETGTVPPLQVVPRAQTANRHAHVVVTRQNELGRNIEFVDTFTGRTMSREELVDAILHTDQYPDYYVRTIHGVPTPVSRPNATTDDNLG